MLGRVDGDDDGVSDGCDDGFVLGGAEGLRLADTDGLLEKLGLSLGIEVGRIDTEGLSEGWELGWFVGQMDTDGFVEGWVRGGTRARTIGSAWGHVKCTMQYLAAHGQEFGNEISNAFD